MKILPLLVLTSMVSMAHANPSLHAWSVVAKPTSGINAESIGKYTAGCIRGATALPINGSGYQVMRLSRKRYYGHPDLIHFIVRLGQETHQQKLGTLLVGDLGQPRGGPTLTGHRSHQTGLDADIWYQLSKEADNRQLSPDERENWGSPSVVKNGAGGIDYLHWSQNNAKVLELAALMPEVDRIFVNAHVKRELCNSSSSRDWLQKIRPWFAHADHFHVRLKCPKDDRNCYKQDPVPAGDGCGADLAWWFSDDAKKPAKKAPPTAITLPKECEAVLSE